MRFSKQSFILAICLFVIAFKVMAGSIFIQSAIERAQLQGGTCVSVQSEQNLSSHDSSEFKDPVHSMYLMYHVTANISDTSLTVPVPAWSKISFFSQNDSLKLDNIPESAYKPPKLPA